MSKYFNSKLIAKVILVACCLALMDKRSDAFFVGNFIGCNSFGCRIAALEQDVGQLKQQVMRLSAGNGMNQFQQPNTMPYNQQGMNQQGMNQQGMNQQGMNQQQLPNNGLQNQMNQQGVNPQQPQQQLTTRQTYANALGNYPDELRRTQAAVPYQNPSTGQFTRA